MIVYTHAYPTRADAEAPETVDGLTYDDVKYNVYAFGCDVKRAMRKRDAARKPHTRAAYERERASAQRWLESNQQRLAQCTKSVEA